MESPRRRQGGGNTRGSGYKFSGFWFCPQRPCLVEAWALFKIDRLYAWLFRAAVTVLRPTAFNSYWHYRVPSSPLPPFQRL